MCPTCARVRVRVESVRERPRGRRGRRRDGRGARGDRSTRGRSRTRISRGGRSTCARPPHDGLPLVEVPVLPPGGRLVRPRRAAVQGVHGVAWAPGGVRRRRGPPRSETPAAAQLTQPRPSQFTTKLEDLARAWPLLDAALVRIRRCWHWLRATRCGWETRVARAVVVGLLKGSSPLEAAYWRLRRLHTDADLSGAVHHIHLPQLKECSFSY